MKWLLQLRSSHTFALKQCKISWVCFIVWVFFTKDIFLADRQEAAAFVLLVQSGSHKFSTAIIETSSFYFFLTSSLCISEVLHRLTKHFSTSGGKNIFRWPPMELMTRKGQLSIPFCQVQATSHHWWGLEAQKAVVVLPQKSHRPFLCWGATKLKASCTYTNLCHIFSVLLREEDTC